VEHREALDIAKNILAKAKVPAEEVPRVSDFLRYAEVVANAAKDLTARQRGTLKFDFKDWAETWRDLHGRWNRVVEADPMVAYEPANPASLAFHSSPAYIRYFRAGNRTSKTQSGYAEHYLVTTGQHKWRHFGAPPVSTVLVAGMAYTDYTEGVFAAKFLKGEDNNPLAPIFPEGGKWFYHYDARQYIITIACPPCAVAGKAGSCKHPKSSIKLLSGEKDWESLQGTARTLIHFDEHVDETFFDEARQRTGTTGGCIIVTGTPLHGFEAWEHRRLTSVFDDGPPSNLTDPSDDTSAPIVSLHKCSMYEGGLVPKWKVDMEASLMDEFERDARINGNPAPLTKNPVFDREATLRMKRECRPPTRGSLFVKPEVEMTSLQRPEDVEIHSGLSGPLRVWKMPEEGEVYVIAVDTASGLTERIEKGLHKREGDASCASVLRVFPHGLGMGLEMVAQWHGWVTPYDYATEVFKLAVKYNGALAVIELTGGLGVAVMQRMKNDFFYWNLYREPADLAAAKFRLDARMGVDTSSTTKPFMVACLKQFIKEGRIAIYDDATIEELNAFEQVTMGAGGAMLEKPKYMGAGGAKDDRVMSLAIGCSVAVSSPHLIFVAQHAQENKAEGPSTSKDMGGMANQLRSERQAGSGLD
jgi:hypothetical protein